MIDGLLVSLHFSLLCYVAYRVAKQYGISIRQDIHTEMTKREHLISCHDDLQKQLTISQQEVNEQEAVCDILFGKVQYWKQNFDLQNIRASEKLHHNLLIIKKRRAELDLLRKTNTLQKELIAAALKEAKIQLQEYYAQEASKIHYNQMCLSHCEASDNHNVG